MIDFEDIPNKKLGENTSNQWPVLGASFLLNAFYRQFDGAEGWLGDSYFTMWSRKEYPNRYCFFGSDGGGTQFGFFVADEGVEFCSAPDIGGEEDIRNLGGWEQFIASVKANDYI